jgi:hypothetical protein
MCVWGCLKEWAGGWLSGRALAGVKPQHKKGKGREGKEREGREGGEKKKEGRTEVRKEGREGRRKEGKKEGRNKGWATSGKNNDDNAFDGKLLQCRVMDFPTVAGK